MRILTKNPPLLWRIFGFLAVFVVISSTLGPRIINHSLVNSFGFVVYGGAGKALVFAALAFGILVYRKKQKCATSAWSWQNVAWVGAWLASFGVAWVAISRLQAGTAGLLWPVLAHLGILGSIGFALLAIMGLGSLRELWRCYRREILLSLAIGVGFYVFLELVYSLWTVLATVATHGAYVLLQASGLPVSITPPYILVLGSFAIEISKFCSGIESIALFTGFYAVVGLLDRTKLDFRKYALAFLPGLLVLFACNIVRIYGLMLTGYYINPDIALRLFHTYAGMVFFIIYIALFWRVTYRWMLKKVPVKTQ